MKLLYGLAFVASFATACVANVFCDPHSPTKSEQKESMKLGAILCLSSYNDGTFTPTAAQNPKYADPIVAASEARNNLLLCLSTLAVPSGHANPDTLCP